MRTLLSRLLSLFRAREVEEALDEEIRAHLELLAADYQRRGMTPREARLAARRAFGGTEQIKEQYRDQRSFRSLEDLRRDVAYALRTFARNPTFSAVAIATLAIGIAATTATFSVVKAVLLEPLPYADPDRLVQIVENIPAAESLSGAPIRLSSMNQDEFDWWRSRTKTLSHMALLIPESRTMLTEQGAVRLPAARVSPALFPMLGVQPVLGRWLQADEERPDADVVVLSVAAWRQYFGSNPNVIGRVIVLDGRSYAVVGIMPPQFDMPAQDTAVWIPHAVERPRPGVVSIDRVTSRLGDGVSIEAATAEADVLGRQLRELPPDEAEAPRFEIVRTKDQMVTPVTPALRVLGVAVGVVLLIVCANVANLLLVRGATRQRELSIRHAIGAGRARIVRQLLTECGVLSVAGGIAGAVLAVAAVRLLKVLTVVDIPAVFSRVERTSGGILPRVDQINVDGGVLAFALGLSMLTGVLFGVVPAMRASRVDLRMGTRAGGLSNASGASGHGYGRVGPLLAIVQVIMATTLLVGAGLLLHSFVRLSNVDAGFDPEGVVHFQLVLPQQQPPEEKLRVAGDVTARLQALPRVEAVGFTNSPPLENLSLFASFLPPGMTDREFLQIPRRERPQARSVSAGYLPAMGVRLLEGRWLDDKDTPGRPRVVLVNRAYARRYLGGKSPIGILLTQGTYQAEVVGLVDDLRMRTLDGVTEPAVFGEPNQLLRSGALPGPSSVDAFIVGPSGAMSFAVRVNGDPLSIAPDLRAIVRQVDPRAAIEGMAPMREIVAGTLARPRFYAATLNAFGIIATVLAAIGIYGVLGYSVTQRTQEIGIRLAIGAAPGEVLALVLRQGGTIALVGILLGIAGATGLSRYLEGLLFGVTPLDPATYALVAVVFAAVAMLASYVPARRATKVDPLMALRSE